MHRNISPQVHTIGSCVVALIFGVSATSAQTSFAIVRTEAITGLVFDRNTNTPIGNARVVLTSLADSIGLRTAVTDSAGSYRLANVPFGQYAFAIGRFGYDDVVLEIVVDRTAALSVSVGLGPAPLALPPLTVETEPNARRERMSAAAPSVSSRRNTIDAAEISQRNLTHQTALAVIRRLRPGWLTLRGDVGTAGARGNNRIILYVDGVRRGVADDAQSIDGGMIGRIYLFDAIEATQRWGTGHVSGAINIVLRPVG